MSDAEATGARSSWEALPAEARHRIVCRLGAMATRTRAAMARCGSHDRGELCTGDEAALLSPGSGGAFDPIAAGRPGGPRRSDAFIEHR